MVTLPVKCSIKCSIQRRVMLCETLRVCVRVDGGKGAVLRHASCKRKRGNLTMPLTA